MVVFVPTLIFEAQFFGYLVLLRFRYLIFVIFSNIETYLVVIIKLYLKHIFLFYAHDFIFCIFQYNRLINDMLTVYNTASVCLLHAPFTCGLRLQPDLTHIMATNRNWDELQHIWTEWRRHTGHNIKDAFEQMAHISNEAAKLNSKRLQSFQFIITIMSYLSSVRYVVLNMVKPVSSSF